MKISAWHHVESLKPTEDDANEKGEILWAWDDLDIQPMFASWDTQPKGALYWLGLPKRRKASQWGMPLHVEKLPAGYRLVDKSEDQPDPKALIYILHNDEWCKRLKENEGQMYDPLCFYAVPIEKKVPKQTYRPFRTMAEFKPYRHLWWRYKGHILQTLLPPLKYGDIYHGQTSFEKRFEECEFEEGIPFGLPIETEKD